MSEFLSGRFRGLDPYVPGEQPKDKKYIKLNTNESPFPPAAGISKRIAELGAVDGLRLYPDPTADNLKKAFAETFGVEKENVFLAGGSDEVLDLCFTCFCERGVIFPDVTYGFYSVFADLRGIEYKEIPLDSSLRINISDYIEESEKTAVFPNPNAPTGLLLSTGDIAKIAEANGKRLVIIDEAYIDFGGESAVSLINDFDNILVVGTFSKSRSLAGARVGYAVGSPDVIRDLETLKFSSNPYDISVISLIAAEEALKDKEYFDFCRNEIIKNREYTKEKLAKLGFEVTDSYANFVFVKHPSLDGEETYLKLKEAGILVRHFKTERIKDYVRVTIGKREDMDAFLSALTKILEDETK